MRRRFDVVGPDPARTFFYFVEGSMEKSVQLTISRAHIGALLRLAGAMADVEHGFRLAFPAHARESASAAIKASNNYAEARKAALVAARAFLGSLPELIEFDITSKGELKISAGGHLANRWAYLCTDDLITLAHSLLLGDEI